MAIATQHRAGIISWARYSNSEACCSPGALRRLLQEVLNVAHPKPILQCIANQIPTAFHMKMGSQSVVARKVGESEGNPKDGIRTLMTDGLITLEPCGSRTACLAKPSSVTRRHRNNLLSLPVLHLHLSYESA